MKLVSGLIIVVARILIFIGDVVLWIFFLVWKIAKLLLHLTQSLKQEFINSIGKLKNTYFSQKIKEKVIFSSKTLGKQGMKSFNFPKRIGTSFAVPEVKVP